VWELLELDGLERLEVGVGRSEWGTEWRKTLKKVREAHAKLPAEARGKVVVLE
jgi:hypothetical protein